MGGGDLLATNSKETPNRVVPRTSDRHSVNARLSVELPPMSWTMTRLLPATA